MDRPVEVEAALKKLEGKLGNHTSTHVYISNLELRVVRLMERLEIEQEQFKQIRLYTQDGDLACICADHETEIKKLLNSLSNKEQQ